MVMLRFIPLLFILFLHGSLQAQGPANILKGGGSLLSLFYLEGDGGQTLGGVTLSMEHQVSSKFSLCFGANFNTQEESFSAANLSSIERTSFFTFEPEIRWYPKMATQGFYLGFAPGLYLEKDKLSGTINSIDKYTLLGAGLKLGYQFSLNNHLTMQVGSGAGLVFYPEEGDGGFLQTNLNVLLGYQF